MFNTQNNNTHDATVVEQRNTSVNNQSILHQPEIRSESPSEPVQMQLKTLSISDANSKTNFSTQVETNNMNTEIQLKLNKTEKPFSNSANTKNTNVEHINLNINLNTKKSTQFDSITSTSCNSNNKNNQSVIQTENENKNEHNKENIDINAQSEPQQQQIEKKPHNVKPDESQTETQTEEEKQKRQRKLAIREKKKQYNILIRAGKEFENAKNYLQALFKYLAAYKLVEKEKLLRKIEDIQETCLELQLDNEEEAFIKVDEHWYQNVVTDNYHLVADEEIEREDDAPDEEYVIPSDIWTKLYVYQRVTLRWFWRLHQKNMGGILGDDMGLGKTVQMSSFLNGAFYSNLIKRVLLVVPVSVMGQWKNELKIWAPNVRLLDFHSSIGKTRRQKNLYQIVEQGGILVTTYGMVQKNQQLLSFYIRKDDNKTRNRYTNGRGGKRSLYSRKFTTKLGVNDEDNDSPMNQAFALQKRKKRKKKQIEFTDEMIEWDYMILDEGHRIKNHLIATSKACRAVPVPNSHKFILSGTFLQNRLSELWSLFDFISTGSLFGTYREFNEEFANRIQTGRRRDATLIEKQISVKLTELLKKTIDPYLLRRTKVELLNNKKLLSESNNEESVAKLKAKTPMLNCVKSEIVVWVTMSEGQISLYQKFLESEAIQTILNTSKSPLACLTVLRKICVHPFLLSDKMKHCEDLSDLTRLSTDRSVENCMRCSSKMAVLQQILLSQKHTKHRILVFSQYRIILNMIEDMLQQLQFKYLRMDGSTDINDRQIYVDTFNSQPVIKVFLLTTKVGGLGLNLTGADRVIIYDPAWNPASDAQAVDRSYRIGQKNDVLVYRLVMCAAIEEKMYRRQISKVGLLKTVTEKQTNQHRYFTKSELKAVFSLDDPLKSDTQLQFRNLHKHRIGRNPEFDCEMSQIEDIPNVFGISSHDLLFATCPQELEENPDLASEINELKVRLQAKTPHPMNRTNRKTGKKNMLSGLKKVTAMIAELGTKQNLDFNENEAGNEEHEIDDNEFEQHLQDLDQYKSESPSTNNSLIRNNQQTTHEFFDSSNIHSNPNSHNQSVFISDQHSSIHIQNQTIDNKSIMQNRSQIQTNSFIQNGNLNPMIANAFNEEFNLQAIMPTPKKDYCNDDSFLHASMNINPGAHSHSASFSAHFNDDRGGQVNTNVNTNTSYVSINQNVSHVQPEPEAASQLNVNSEPPQTGFTAHISARSTRRRRRKSIVDVQRMFAEEDSKRNSDEDEDQTESDNEEKVSTNTTAVNTTDINNAAIIIPPSFQTTENTWNETQNSSQQWAHNSNSTDFSSHLFGSNQTSLNQSAVNNQSTISNNQNNVDTDSFNQFYTSTGTIEQQANNEDDYDSSATVSESDGNNDASMNDTQMMVDSETDQQQQNNINQEASEKQEQQQDSAKLEENDPNQIQLSTNTASTAEELFAVADADNNASLEQSLLNTSVDSNRHVVSNRHTSKRFKRYRRKSFIASTLDDLSSDSEPEPEHNPDTSECTSECHADYSADASRLEQSSYKSQPESRTRSPDSDYNSDFREPVGQQTTNMETKTVCDHHLSELADMHGIDCKRCLCLLSESDLQRYESFKQLANNAEKEQNWEQTLNALMQALDICDSEITLHTRCSTIGQILFQLQFE